MENENNSSVTTNETITSKMSGGGRSVLVNKVVYNNEPLIDLTGDTVKASDLPTGVIAHDASGNRIIGENRETVIDLSGEIYNHNTWYPVVRSPELNRTKTEHIYLFSKLTESFPQWGTRGDHAYSCYMELDVLGSGWGSTPGNLIISSYAWVFANEPPMVFRHYHANTRAVFFLRGGGIYHIVDEKSGRIWTPYTERHDFSFGGEFVEPQNEIPQNSFTDLYAAQIGIQSHKVRNYIITSEEQLIDVCNSLHADVPSKVSSYEFALRVNATGLSIPSGDWYVKGFSSYSNGYQEAKSWTLDGGGKIRNWFRIFSNTSWGNWTEKTN